MNNYSPLTILLCLLVVFNCSSNESKFPTDKRYWTPEDYSNAIWQIEFRTPDGEPYPRFSNPETSIIIKKLVDPQNYEVILDDPELGLNHKNEMSQAFFDQYKDLAKVYRVMDVQDKYVYPQELIEIEKFGLGLEIKYFKLGNDRIMEQSDAPESATTKEYIRSNVQNIIKNFTIYLDYINDEKSFSKFAPMLADGISVYFFTLMDTFPNGNYDVILDKANLMLKKTKTEEIRVALTNLINKIESMKAEAKK